jgi:putative ABC transport system substrate-binding protein
MIRRREFIAVLGGAAAWPLAAGAQHRAAMPTIGFLHPQSPDGHAPRLTAFHRSLNEMALLRP